MYFTVVSFFGKQGKQKKEGKVELFRASGSCIRARAMVVSGG